MARRRRGEGESEWCVAHAREGCPPSCGRRAAERDLTPDRTSLPPDNTPLADIALIANNAGEAPLRGGGRPRATPSPLGDADDGTDKAARPDGGASRARARESTMGAHQMTCKRPDVAAGAFFQLSGRPSTGHAPKLTSTGRPSIVVDTSPQGSSDL